MYAVDTNPTLYHTTRLNVSIAAAQDPAHKSMDSIPHSALSIMSTIHDEKARPGNTTPQMRHVKPAKCIVSMNGDHYYDT